LLIGLCSSFYHSGHLISYIKLAFISFRMHI